MSVQPSPGPTSHSSKIASMSLHSLRWPKSCLAAVPIKCLAISSSSSQTSSHHPLSRSMANNSPSKSPISLTKQTTQCALWEPMLRIQTKSRTSLFSTAKVRFYIALTPVQKRMVSSRPFISSRMRPWSASSATWNTRTTISTSLDPLSKRCTTDQAKKTSLSSTCEKEKKSSLHELLQQNSTNPS